MGKTTAETIKEITRNHLTNDKGLLFGQCVSAVGWIGGTVPDCEGIVEIPMTDVAGPGFAVGAAIHGIRPIFVVRYQGFMWYNVSSLVNYAAKSKAIWNRPCPIFIRSLAMEGNGVGHTASSAVHSIFMHQSGMPVVSPMTPNEYTEIWNHFKENDDPMYVSEHRLSFTIDYEMEDQLYDDADITVLGISAGRMNSIKAIEILKEKGVKCNFINILWLKPFKFSDKLLSALKSSKLGLVVDSDYEICGASKNIAFDLMHMSGVNVHALGLEDRPCGVAKEKENITPSPEKIAAKVLELLNKEKY